MSEEKLEQYWDIKVFKDNPTFPFVVFDNWYTPEEEKAVWKELDFISIPNREETLRAENTIVAKNIETGESLSKAYRYYLHEYYHKQTISPILNCMYKQRTPEFKNILKDNCMPYARSFCATNRDSTLISYYEDNDHYKPHFDSFMWTCLIWMVRDRNLFTGADFWFPEPDVKINLKNNRMVIFPSCYEHAVDSLKFHKTPKDIGHGKYTITHFYYSVPEGDYDDSEL